MEETDPANFARHSWLRKLRDPFVYNETTQAAAIATETKAKAKSERRGGWQHFIGLKYDSRHHRNVRRKFFSPFDVSE